MGTPIRVLIVEDSEDDTALIVRELKRNGYDVMFERVDNHKAMKNAFDKQEWDAVIADYAMPKFSMEEALELLRESKHDIPFVLVSGTIGEDVAVEAMKAGADDYIMKDKLSRLVPAIKRELREAKRRREHKQAEAAIQTLVRSTVGTTGQDFFDRVVRSVCEWLGTDCAFIGQIGDGNNVKALSMQLDGEIINDFGYSISDGPCENVTKEGYCVYIEGVCKLFPNNKVISEMGAEGYVGIPLRDKSSKPIGILWTVSRHKLNMPRGVAEVMDIIAAKASSEIERMWAEEKRKKNEEHFRRVIENIFKFVPDGLLVFTDKLDLFKKNKAFQEIVQKYSSKLNYTEQELTEKIIEEVKKGITNKAHTEIKISKKHG